MEYPYWLNILDWNRADFYFILRTKNILDWNIPADIFLYWISLLTDIFGLKYPCWHLFYTGMSLLTKHILDWNIPTGTYLILECPYWLNILDWNIPTDTYFILECPYWLNILDWNIPTDTYFILKCPYWIFWTGISLLTLIWYWNVPTD
jgi:hypothetical protein